MKLASVVLVTSLVLTLAWSADGLKCYCSTTDINYPPHHDCTAANNSCVSSIGCVVQWVYIEQVVQTRYDCLESDHNLLTSYCHTTGHDNAVRCCNNSDYCNRDIDRVHLPIESVLSQHPSATAATSTTVSTTPGPQCPSAQTDDSLNFRYFIGLTFSLPLSAAIIIAAIAIPFIIRYRRHKVANCNERGGHQAPRGYERSRQTSSLGYDFHNALEPNEISSTCSVVSGHPLLTQQSIASHILLGECIGLGRRGRVFLGTYENENVAVKMFPSKYREFWLNEIDIYTTVLIQDENIQAFVASETVSVNGSTELWLVTPYHPNKSLAEYLTSNALPASLMLQMVASVCSGLAYLHREIPGTKPSVAHRNITSRNILVKSDLFCCIADFSLAVVKPWGTFSSPISLKDGSVRYMAPEILNETMNLNYFESFKQADIYALGLVLWEICRRCTGTSGIAEDYELPFQGMVPPDPSFEDMKRLVVIERRQPSIPNRWQKDELLSEMGQMMKECWYHVSSARHTAVYLKKKVQKMAQYHGNQTEREGCGGNSTEREGRGYNQTEREGRADMKGAETVC